MDQKEANKRLAAIESEAEQLRAFLRGPKPGDVVQEPSGRMYVCTSEGKAFDPSGGSISLRKIVEYDVWKNGTEKNLGPFSDVFIRRDEVRKAVRDILHTPDEFVDTLDRLSECSSSWLDLTSSSGAMEIQSIVNQLKKLAK